jgi:hypothetical protein
VAVPAWTLKYLPFGRNASAISKASFARQRNRQSRLTPESLLVCPSSVNRNEWLAADSSRGEPLKPGPNADSPRRVRFWNGTRDLSAPAAAPIRLTSSVGGQEPRLRKCDQANAAIPNQHSCKHGRIRPRDVGTERTAAPIIAGRVGPGTVRIIRMGPPGEGSQMKRRGRRRRDSLEIPIGAWPDHLSRRSRDSELCLREKTIGKREPGRPSRLRS